MKQLLDRLWALGPYLLVAVLLPGGSLIALAAWLFRRLKKQGTTDAHAEIAPAPRADVGAAGAARLGAGSGA